MADQPILITPSGHKKLQDEITFLWQQERPSVTRAVSDAAALGDRSENADYIYGKKRLREIDRRLRWLSKRLDVIKVINPTTVADTTRIAFGATVSLEDDDGHKVRYQIVGPDEFDVDEGKISYQSPVAHALMGKQVDDEVEVKRPRGVICYTVLEIEYK